MDDFVITWTSKPDKRKTYQRHPAHFIDDYVVLKVEDTLFRVERSLLCEFGVFQDMFENATTHLQDETEGTTDQNPIELQGISAFDIESLFHVLEARWIDGAPHVGIEQWKAVLHFATMWEHDTLRGIAIKKINSLNLLPVEKLRLASKYQVDKWLKPASVELCLRPSPLTYEEGQLLGLPYILGLSSIRERCWSIQLSCSSCKKCKRITGNCSACNRSFGSESVNRRYSSYPPSYSTKSVPLCSGTCRDPPPSIESLREAEATQLVEAFLDTGVRPLPEEKDFKKTELPGGWIPKGRHPRFYSDDSIVYEVGKLAFCTPDNILRTFRALHGAMESAVANQPGANVLFSIKTESSSLELSTTLDVLNFRWFTGAENLSFEQWKAVLRVATEWDNPKLRQASINMIEGIGPKPLDSILLARKCNVPQWLPDAYTKLCMRKDPISAKEGTLLGIETFAELNRIRESRKRSCKNCRSRSINITCKNCHADAEQVVLAGLKKLLPKGLRHAAIDPVVVTTRLMAPSRSSGTQRDVIEIDMLDFP